MATWEYCQLIHETDRRGAGSFRDSYFSSDLNEHVENDEIREAFADWEDALGYLGANGWEAFSIDPDGNWFFKRPDDWDTEWEIES